MTAVVPRTAACVGEHYPDEATARQAIAERRAAGQRNARTTRCRHCGQWRRATRGQQDTSKPTQTTWYRVYKYRMNHGLERCRWPGCGRRDTLTFDHITPHSVSRRWRFEDITILCLPHNQAKGPAEGSTLRSLAEEEAEAPPGQRWSQIGRVLYGLPKRTRYGSR